MADGFVEENSGPAVTEDDFHVSGGSGDGVELEDGLARGFVSVMLGGLAAFKEIEFDATAAAGGSAGGVLRIAGEDEDIHAGEGLGVGGEGTVGAGDENAAELVGEAGADLHDARIEGAGSNVGAADEGEFGGDVGVGGGACDGVKLRRAGLGESCNLLGGGAVGD